MQQAITDSGSAKREQLVDVALKLFYEKGFHATGIDTILAASGVAKMTLYKHFPSKEDLIIATLRKRDQMWMDWFKARIGRVPARGARRVLAVFDALQEWFDGRGPGGTFSGCAFINVAAEYAECDHPIHAVAAEHKRAVREYIQSLARDAGLPRAVALAAQLTLLAEGAIVMAHVAGDRDACVTAKSAAKRLIEASSPHRTASKGSKV